MTEEDSFNAFLDNMLDKVVPDDMPDETDCDDDRVECPVCHRLFHVTIDGFLRAHGPRVIGALDLSSTFLLSLSLRVRL